MFVLALAACDPRGAPQPPPPTPTPTTAPAKHPAAPADAGATQGFIGVVTAAESVDIAPRFQGVVATVKVRPGDAVTADQVVAEMDRKSMEEELRAAQATYGAAIARVRQAQVDVEDARRKLQIETKAVADGLSPRNAIDEAKLALKRAQAAAEQASSAAAQESSHVQTARDHLSDLALKAPTDGTVAMRFKDPGATVAAGTAIVRIVGHGGLRLKFAVPPDQAQALKPGGSVHAKVDTVAQPVDGTIRQVSPTLDPSSGMIIVEAEVVGDAASSSALRPGLAAWVK
jgi:RND family efflux transporter MFP subunit